MRPSPAPARALRSDTALIGFCGAPWTVATYMVAGRGTDDQAPARLMALREPEVFQKLIDHLVEMSIAHLIGQIEAGRMRCRSSTPGRGSGPAVLRAVVLRPAGAHCGGHLGEEAGCPHHRLPKGASTQALARIAALGVNAVGLDWTADRAALRKLGEKTALQGNLDPLRLIAGGPQLDEEILRIRTDFDGMRHIFNLGHGIKPETPIAHVERLVEKVRSAL